MGFRHRHGALVMLVLMTGVWSIGTVAAGRFTTTDEIAFKAAGREWAQTGRFAAPELTGFGHFDPPVERIWFAQLPVYTFGFGVFVRVFGFGPIQSMAYDAIIHAILILLTFALCRAMAPETSPLAALAAGALLLPIATFGRADELAIGLAMAGLVLVTRPVGLLRLIAAGVLFGVSMATSGMAALLLALQAIVVVRAQARSLAMTVRDLAIMGIVGTAAALACVAPILVAHPDAVQQFRAHAGHQFAIAFSWGIVQSWVYGKPYLLPVLAGMIVGAYGMVMGRSDRAGLRFGAATCAVILIVLFLPAKPYYLLFVIPILAAGSCATLAELGHRRSLAVWMAFAVYLAGLAIPLQQIVVHATLPASQRLAPNAATIRRLVPRGSVVLASEFWSSIANDYEFRSLVHGEPDFSRIDYVILTGNGSGTPGEPQKLTPEQQSALAAGFEVVHDNLRLEAPRLMGIRLSHSGWGYGTRILARKIR